MAENSEQAAVSDEAVASAAASAALKTSGVYSLLAGFTETIQESILGKTIEAPGVKISRNGEHVKIDVSLVIEYGYQIPSVAWNIQKNVKRQVEQLGEISVDSVDVHVQKIHFNIE
ncbi:MAG: Asp23/Gls24 family envelope stress response protein [Anaerovoracaceae bacterium]|nr:Asp23/Gls24 family envelope stress response protein [Bacillota bacterium]MDY2669957.1 Asp23/Gls24 family envelope stress response protein [Anaerovoracaceae bacterium]